MFVCVYVLNFLLLCLIFLFFGFRDGLLANIRLAFVKSMVLMAFFTFLVTEGLSYFNKFSYPPVLSIWSVLATGLCVAVIILFKTRIVRKCDLDFGVLQGLDKSYIIVLASSFVLIILPLFFLAIFYPPNNWDSLQYHLPRIEHWIQNCSINHYITGDARQLYTPPLAEFIGLHLRILSGKDYWLNLIQFFAMLGCLFLVSLTVRTLGFNYKYQILGILLTLSIAMGVLQATTTQTDYVCAFFLCAVLFWGLLLARAERLNWAYVVWGGVSLGLGFLTKPMVGIFALPFVFWMAIVFLKRWRFKALGVGFVFLFFILLVNTPFWLRNYQQCGNFLGLINFTQNEKMNGVFLASNIIRNVATHCALPFGNSALNRFIIFFHRNFLGISPIEREITFDPGPEYGPFFGIFEDVAGNFFVLPLLLFLMGYVLFNIKKILRAKKYFLIFYLFSLLGSYFLFTFMLKWQPWITRLDLPFFVIAIPFMIMVLYEVYTEGGNAARLMNWFLLALSCYWLLAFAIKYRAIFFMLAGGFLLVYWMFVKKILGGSRQGVLIFCTFLFTTPYVYFNSVKHENAFFAPRERKYFRSSEKTYKDHLEIAHIIEKFGVRSIVLPSGRPCEYLLWIVLRNRLGDAFSIVNLNVGYDLSKKSLFEDQSLIGCCDEYVAIVSYTEKMISLVDAEAVVFRKTLGTEKDPLFLVVLKNKNAIGMEVGCDCA